MKKRFKPYHIFLAVILLVVIFVGIRAATTGSVSTLNPGHNSTQVFISVGNNFITLQNAIDTGYLLKANTSSVPTTSLPTSSPYHFANQTLINITVGSTNYTMTLQEAINNNVFINGASVSYTKNISKGGEYAYNINVNTTSGVQNLQSAIKNNLLSSLGIAPFCLGKKVGTPCGSDDWHACDGSGKCEGYSGTGCGSCPFGKQSTASANAGGGSYDAYCYTCNSGNGIPCNSPYFYYNSTTNYNGRTYWSNTSFAVTCAYEYGGTCSLGICGGYNRYDATWKIKP